MILIMYIFYGYIFKVNELNTDIFVMTMLAHRFIQMGAAVTKKNEKDISLEDLGLDSGFFQGEPTAAHRMLYRHLKNMIDYEEPYKDPSKMARYFDSFLEFLRQEYGEDNIGKGTLQSLIPSSFSMKLPDGSSILITYDIANRRSNFEILTKTSDLDQVGRKHIELADYFKNALTDAIFHSVTSLITAMPKEARDKVEKEFLAAARKHSEVKP